MISILYPLVKVFLLHCCHGVITYILVFVNSVIFVPFSSYVCAWLLCSRYIAVATIVTVVFALYFSVAVVVTVMLLIFYLFPHIMNILTTALGFPFIKVLLAIQINLSMLMT